MAIFGKSRQIDIDIVANDKTSGVFAKVGNEASSMALKLNSSINNMNSGLNRYNNAMSGLYRSTQIAMVGAGYLVYNFTKQSIQAFAEFERQHGKTMGAIANNYGKTVEAQKKFLEDTKALKAESIRLGTVGPDGKGSLTDPIGAASAQTALAKSGVPVDKINEITPQIIKFAGGNNLGVEQASDYAVNLANMFNVPMEKWGEMLDMVTRAADLSTVDVPDIFESMKYAGEMGSSLKRSMEEVLGMIVVLGNSGLKGSQAGTGIQAFMTRLLTGVGVSNPKQLESAPTQRVSDRATGLIDDVVDEKGNFKTMPDITQKLNDAMTDLNDQEQAWLTYKLFGLYQMKAGYKLANNGGATLQDIISNVKDNAPGTNDKKWDIMLSTSYGRQQAFKNMVTGTQTDVGDRLSPFTNSIMEELFKALSSKGNYNIDFSKLKTSLSEASKLIEEQYGKRIGDFVQSLGTFALDGSRVGAANAPIVEGGATALLQLLGGDIPGAFSTMKQSVLDANDNIDKLPPELQDMARETKNAMLALMTLAGINFGAKLMESLSTIWKYTVGKIITNTMNVTAANVILKDTGVLNKDGKPVYKEETVTTKDTNRGGGGSGGTAVPSTTTVDTNGKKVSGGPEPGSTIVNSRGEQISSSKTTVNSNGTTIVDSSGRPINGGSEKQTNTSTPVTGAGSKIGGALNKASWIYAIGEMFGLNDYALDSVGATKGTKAREYADKGRTGLNYTLMASFVDDILAKGAGKQLIKKGFQYGANGASKIIPSIAGLEGSAGLGVSVPILGTAIATILYEKSKNDQYQQNMKNYKKATAEGKPIYFDDKGEQVYGRTKEEQKKWQHDAQYTFGGDYGAQITEAAPNKWLHPIKYKQWEKRQAELDAKTKSEENVWNYASAESERYTGNKLKWDDYSKNKDSWQSAYDNKGESWDKITSKLIAAFGSNSKPKDDGAYELAKSVSTLIDGKSIGANDYLNGKDSWQTLFKSQSDVLSKIAEQIKTEKADGTYTDESIKDKSYEYANSVSKQYTGKDLSKEEYSANSAQWETVLQQQLSLLEQTNKTIDGMNTNNNTVNKGIADSLSTLAGKIMSNGKITQQDKDDEVWKFAQNVSDSNGKQISFDDFNKQKDDWTSLFVQQCDTLAQSIESVNQSMGTLNGSIMGTKIGDVNVAKPNAQNGYVGGNMDGMFGNNGNGGGGQLQGDVYGAIIGVKDAQAPISTTLSTINDGVSKNSDMVSNLSTINSSVQTLANQPPPVVNVAPPSVSVNVSVDKSGYVSQDTSYIPSSTALLSFDKAIGREMLRSGKK